MTDYHKHKRKSLDKLMVKRVLDALVRTHPDRACGGCTECCTGTASLSRRAPARRRGRGVIVAGQEDDRLRWGEDGCRELRVHWRTCQCRK
jgi:hypothetical protein